LLLLLHLLLHLLLALLHLLQELFRRSHVGWLLSEGIGLLPVLIVSGLSLIVRRTEYVGVLLRIRSVIKDFLPGFLSLLRLSGLVLLRRHFCRSGLSIPTGLGGENHAIQSVGVGGRS